MIGATGELRQGRLGWWYCNQVYKWFDSIAAKPTSLKGELEPTTTGEGKVVGGEFYRTTS